MTCKIKTTSKSVSEPNSPGKPLTKKKTPKPMQTNPSFPTYLPFSRTPINAFVYKSP